MTCARLLACDLDHTLLTANNVADPRTKEVLQAIGSVGVQVLIVTGRPPRWLWPAAAALDHYGLAVVANGALLIDCATRKVLERDVPDDEEFAVIRSVVCARWPGSGFAVETTDRMIADPLVRLRPSENTLRLADWSDFAPQFDPISKILCTPNCEPQEPVIDILSAEFSGILDVHEMSSRPPTVEFRRQGITKHSAVQRLCLKAGIEPEEVVAIGDERSDVGLISWAGLGIAMSDGHPAAIAAADLLAPPFAENGAASILEQVFGLNCAI